MNRHTLTVIMDRQYPTFVFHDGDREYTLSPPAYFLSDGVQEIVVAVECVLTHKEQAEALMYDEPGEWRVVLTPIVDALEVSVWFRRGHGYEWNSEFVMECLTNRFARDVARCVKSCAAKGDMISERSVRGADFVLALLRGESPSSWT